MCGFTGFVTGKKFPGLKVDLEQAASVLTHRGPDDSGIYFDKRAGVGLAHRRLSIIDLTDAGQQPMATEDGTIQIVYNGEVYNFREIRDTLIELGYRFSSATDTEVILKAYQQWGTECFNCFVGMFALAIWDRNKRTLILARDRLGIKPLYYHRNDLGLLFASELKALMAFDAVRLAVDSEAIPLFLHYQYIPAPRTIFQNTYKLMPGTYLVFNGESTITDTYWEIPNISSPDDSLTLANEQESLERLDGLLTQAVSDRLVSDVPLGALLSGGIDSSLVVALMQKINTSPVKTFSIGFKELEYNEAPHAANIARHLGTDHTELYVTPRDALTIIPRLPDIYDEPFADSSAIPTFLVCQLARSRLTVALSGDGGDEQFAGYVRYWTTAAMSKSLKRLPMRLRGSLSSVLSAIPSSWIAKCYLPVREYLPHRFQIANFEDKWSKLIQQLHQMNPIDLYRMTICLWAENDLFKLIGKHLPNSHYEKLFKRFNEGGVMSRLMRVDQHTYLPDAMLTKVDRASMAVSLEVRVPLIDHRVVEFTNTLPEHFKYRNGTGKYLLKQLLSRYVPSDLFERPKMGFGVPIDHWFRGELKTLLLDYLSPATLKREGLFNPEFVTEKINEHLSGQINHQYRLWSLLIWQMWRERWVG